MPKPLTREAAAALAEQWRAEAARVRTVAELEALGLEEMAREMDRFARGELTIAPERAIKRHMAQVNPLDVVRSRRTAGRGRVSTHPFPKALEAANITMTEMAVLLKEHRSTVKSWLTRKIPRERAEAIAKLIDLPATEKSWPVGIK